MRSETGVSGLQASGMARSRSRSEIMPTRLAVLDHDGGAGVDLDHAPRASAIVVSGETLANIGRHEVGQLHIEVS